MFHGRAQCSSAFNRAPATRFGAPPATLAPGGAAATRPPEMVTFA